MTTNRSLYGACAALTLVLALVGLACGGTEPAAPPRRCDAPELDQLAPSLRARLDCEAERLLDPDASCTEPQLTCGQDSPGRLLELLLHPDEPEPSVADDAGPGRECRIAVLRASARYVETRLQERARGRRPAAGARDLVANVEAACSGSRAGPSGASFGGACAELRGQADAPSEATLARCIRASIERILDDAASEPLRPNIVLVLTDDQRPETLEFMPELERLAAEGVRFTNAFATTPLCTPSRASIYSGQYAHNHGAKTNRQTFDDSDSLAPWLARAGYATGLFGKYRNDVVRGSHVPPGWSEWHVFNEPDPERPICPQEVGCYTDYLLNENGALVSYGSGSGDYSTDLLAERMLGFIETHAEAPFFSVYAPVTPHKPAIPAERHRGRFEQLPPHRPPSWKASSVALKPNWVAFVHSSFDEGRAARTDARRIREIEALQSVDEAVGRIHDQLENLGLRDNTLFIYTSDQGIHWGEHGWTLKFTPYEESIRVPLVVSYPSLAPIGALRDEMVLNIDMAPTIAEAAGARPSPLDGKSFLPLLGREPGDPVPWRRNFLIENFVEMITAPSTAVRTRRWKYIESKVHTGPSVELYDLEADPYELTNLALLREYRPMRKLLARRLRALRTASPGSPSASADLPAR